MMTKARQQVARRDLPAGQKLVHIKTRKPIKEGDIVLRNGDSNQYRLLAVMFNRQRLLLIDIDLEDKENPHDRKEARAEDIDAKWV